MNNTPSRTAFALFLACGASVAIAQPCAHWDTTIGDPGAGPVTNPQNQPAVYALGAHGGQIYAGGSFAAMGGSPAGRIARWDGGGWWPLGDGVSATSFTWPEVRTVTSFGGSLYVGGRFETAGGFPASRIARWDGEIWHALGSGLTGSGIHVTLLRALDMVVWDDGTGPALFIGGRFTNAGGVGANNIVKWDGTNFSPLGSGVSGNSHTINAMAVFQNNLYVGGGFTSPGNRLASWNGSFWSAVPGFPTSEVNALQVFDDGSGDKLYIATFGEILQWDGASLTNVTGDLFTGGSWFDSAYALTVFDDGEGPALFAGGEFSGRTHFAKWSGTSWTAVAGGIGGQDQPYIGEFLAHEGKLYVAGRFDHLGGHTANAASGIAIYACPEAGCYANCDGSTTEPILNVDDFTCFINEFAAAQSLPHEQQVSHFANCDGSTTAPALNVDDFTCFINHFAQGCP